MGEQEPGRLRHWTAIGTGLFCPVVVSPSAGRVALFTRSAASELFYRERERSGWASPESLEIPIAHAPGSDLPVPVGWQLAACPGSDQQIELFAASPDGDLLHMVGRPGHWGTFECLGAPALLTDGIGIPAGFLSAPAVCSVESGPLHVFVVGHGGDLLHTFRDRSGWSGFDSLGMPGGDHPTPLLEPVAACTCGPTALAVFVRGVRGDLLLKWWDGAKWSDFASLGMPELPDPAYPAVAMPAPLTGPPAACSWGEHRLDVFVRGTRGDLFHKSWDGRQWSAFESLGMPIDDGGDVVPFTGVVTACSSGIGALDVVAKAANGRLYHAYWDGAWEHE